MELITRAYSCFSVFADTRKNYQQSLSLRVFKIDNTSEYKRSYFISLPPIPEECPRKVFISSAKKKGRP
jgi:hypothetical protein